MGSGRYAVVVVIAVVARIAAVVGVSAADNVVAAAVGRIDFVPSQRSWFDLVQLSIEQDQP